MITAPHNTPENLESKWENPLESEWETPAFLDRSHRYQFLPGTRKWVENDLKETPESQVCLEGFAFSRVYRTLFHIPNTGKGIFLKGLADKGAE